MVVVSCYAVESFTTVLIFFYFFFFQDLKAYREAGLKRK